MNESQTTHARTQRRRRRFALSLAPLVPLLLVVEVIFGDEPGLLGVFGFMALMQGIGLAVALVPLAFGYNPLSKD